MIGHWHTQTCSLCAPELSSRETMGVTDMVRQYTQVLTIAGSDPGGGAGIQADLKTFAALGCYGLSVITALTAQSTTGVSAIEPVPSRFIGTQIDAVLKDMKPRAIKIGMLYSVEQLEVVAQTVKKYPVPHVVVDPVMASQGGTSLLAPEALPAFRELMMPLATLVTPNLPEASALLNTQIHTLEEIKAGARRLASYGSNSILVKGGHMGGEQSNDVLFLGPENRFVCFAEKRIQTLNDHGTGCTLSSAIASFLARGEPVEGAVRAGKAFLTEALRAGAAYKIGKGRGPVHHFYRFW